jgi:hypothetical protein
VPDPDLDPENLFYDSTSPKVPTPTGSGFTTLRKTRSNRRKKTKRNFNARSQLTKLVPLYIKKYIAYIQKVL